MIKLDEKSNAQAWELEVTCRNKKYLDEVVKAILKYGMINFEVELVECLRTHEEYDGRYTQYGLLIKNLNKNTKIMEMEDYLVTHLGEGKFQVKMENYEIKDASSNLCGMIRYTYFEDYTLPEIGWQVTRKQLMEDYLPKMQQDVLNGKLKPNQINY